jgi:signal transduction histidine kinase
VDNQAKKITKFDRFSLELHILLIDLVAILSLYIIFPYITNMPIQSMHIPFQMDVMGINFIQVAVIFYLIFVIVQFSIIVPLYRRIDKYIDRYLKGRLIRTDENARQYDQYILKIRSDCLEAPHRFYFILGIFSLCAVIIALCVGFIVGRDLLNDLDAYTILSVIFTVISIWFILNIACITTMIQFNTKILNSTYRPDETEFPRVGKHISMSTITMIQLIPLVLSLVVIFSDFIYVNTVKVKSKALTSYYKLYVDNLDLSDVVFTKEDLLEELDLAPYLQINDSAFVIDPNNEFLLSTNDVIDNFALKYKDYFFGLDNKNKAFNNLSADEDILYEFYGIDVHYYARRIYDKAGKAWYIGYKYNVSDPTTSVNFIISIVLMLFIYFILLYLWSKSQVRNEKTIAESMAQILKSDDPSKVNYIPILSKDEVGDIAYYYNQIQNRMVRQQDILLKQEQLSILGEMAGGMAHDINTPISAINTAITLLSRKHNEDERDIQILQNMQVSTDRIISIVTSMRNQVRNMGSSQKEPFKLQTMANDIFVITANEQKKSGCQVEIDIPEDIVIYGERTKLGQVLTNLVVNSLQASLENEKKGSVIMRATKIENDRCQIEIEDHAGGIPKKVQPYIFNNIMTTKGVKGTGLGLYLASTVIKGIYEGKIYYRTVTGDGTTFIIDIPMNTDQIPKDNLKK